MNQSQNGHKDANDDSWFDHVEVIDQEWVELKVTTSQGEVVTYLVPRRTFFQEIDDAASSAA